MNQQLSPQDEQTRAAVDGRVAFGLSCMAVAALLLHLLDRIGAPEALVSALGPLVCLVGLSIVGLMLRNMQVSKYYAADRSVPAAWAGLAVAGLIGGIVAPLAPPGPGSWGARDLVLGFIGGGALLAFVTGPLLRKVGSYSIVGFLCGRFPSKTLRLVLVVAVFCAASALAAASFETSVRGLQTALGADRRASVTIAAVVVLCIVLPGGASGAVWSAFAGACLYMVGAGLPLAMSALSASSQPLLTFDGAAWTQASARLADWGAVDRLHPALIWVSALGLGVLAPLLMPAVATRDRREAHAAGRSAALWICVMAALCATALAASTLALDKATVGVTPDNLPDAVYAASGRDLVSICGQPTGTAPDAVRACAAGRTGSAPKPLRAGDVTAQGSFLLTALPALDGDGNAAIGLDAAGALALSLALAASAFQAATTTLSNDLLYPMRRSKALTSRRLAGARAIALCLVVGVGALATMRSFEAAPLIAGACAICACVVAPLVALALWPRASAPDALIAIVCGIGAAAFRLIGALPNSSAADWASAALMGMIASVCAGFAVSLLRKPDPLQAGSIFFDRLTHGHGDVLNPDGLGKS